MHRTKDGHLVLAHEVPGRTTNGRGLIADHTLDELRTLDAAHWWVPGTVDDHHAEEHEYVLRGRGPNDEDLRVPTLEEVLDRFTVPLTIEIKSAAAVEPVVRVLRERGVPRDELIVTSFLERAVREL